MNNSIAQATFLGSDSFITLHNLSIHNADDEDFFRYTAHDTGKLVTRSLFDDDLGDIDIEILDSSGDVIASALSFDDDEELIVPVVAQQVYFIRIFGVGTAINNYSMEIENFPPRLPPACISTRPATRVVEQRQCYERHDADVLYSDRRAEIRRRQRQRSWPISMRFAR